MPSSPDLDRFDFAALLAGLEPLPAHRRRATPSASSTRSPPATSRPAARVDDGLPETLEEVDRRLWPPLLQAEGRGRPAGRPRAAAAHRRGARPVAGRSTSRSTATSSTTTSRRSPSSGARWRPSRRCSACARPTLFIEQPIKRQVALERSIARAGAAYRPVIIDESDGELDAFPRARALGYAGVSSKNCKGFYKSLINLARCRVWNARTADAATSCRPRT